MAVDGKWNMTMSTHMGERKATPELKTVGARSGGHRVTKPARLRFEGTVSADDIAWKLSNTNPMPLTLAFTGQVSGDSISGEMGIGSDGQLSVHGNASVKRRVLAFGGSFNPGYHR